jgi:hypothetical protein
MKKIILQICEFFFSLSAASTIQYLFLAAPAFLVYSNANTATIFNVAVVLAGYNRTNITESYNSSESTNAFAQMRYRCFTSGQPNNVSKLMAIEKITFLMPKTQRVKRFGIARASKTTA